MLQTYSLEEVVAEKLRALLQSRQHLRDRGWLRNRPRDLYDLHHLWQQREIPINWTKVGELLPRKAEAYDVAYGSAGDFLDPQVIAGIERDWEAQLANFVPHLPSFKEAVAALREILDEVAPTHTA